MKRILVPMDFSDRSADALNYARALLPEPQIMLVHILDAHDLYRPTFNLPDVPDEDNTPTEFDDHALAQLKEIAQDGEQVRLLEGPPAKAIVQAARDFDADLICMATHGRSGLMHLLLGSVTEEVMRESNVPVLVVPAKREKP
ncbi:universal stress protein [Deinococcus misasensis]|uniref:universal stress protein n=1 Tax=Deinococcus misasensis TaxID=392413 RepID=UPI000554BEBA|nr:universal stress protein [Deinococcus misasensis]